MYRCLSELECSPVFSRSTFDLIRPVFVFLLNPGGVDTDEVTSALVVPAFFGGAVCLLGSSAAETVSEDTAGGSHGRTGFELGGVAHEVCVGVVVGLEEACNVTGSFRSCGLQIVIGSIFTRSRNLLWEAAKEQIDAEALKPSADCCTVVSAELGEQIGDYAAIATALL